MDPQAMGILDQNQMQTINQFQQMMAGGVPDADYQPDVFEYDDEDDYGVQGEKVYLDQNNEMRQAVKTLGTRARFEAPAEVL